jgi:hypothetical protein
MPRQSISRNLGRSDMTMLTHRGPFTRPHPSGRDLSRSAADLATIKRFCVCAVMAAGGAVSGHRAKTAAYFWRFHFDPRS